MARLQRFYKRPESPTDVRTDTEMVLFATETERLKVTNFHHDEHTVAWIDDVEGGGALEWLDVGGQVVVPALEFGVYPQVGPFLHLEVNSDTGDVRGMFFDDNSPTGEILLQSNNRVSLYAPEMMFGPNILDLTSLGAGFTVGQFGIGLPYYDGDNGRFLIDGPPGTPIVYVKTGTAGGANDGTFEIWSQAAVGITSAPVLRMTQDGIFELCCPNGVDSDPHPILRVTKDGTFHIKAGADWVADL